MEEIAVLNTHASNMGASSSIKQILIEMKTQISNNTIIMGDFNTPLIQRDRSTRQKVSKEITELNQTCEQMDLLGMYGVFHPKTSQYTFFSAAHDTFSKIDHTLPHRICLNK